MKKLIKKLVLKYLEKYTGNEFTQMDNRIYDIEVKLGIKKPEHDGGSKYVGDMAVKDAEHITDSSKKELLEKTEELLIEVRQWYKGTYVDDYIKENKALYFVEDISLEGDIKAYGFSYNGKWTDSKNYFTNINRHNSIKATNEEVEAALIAEAKKRYKKGDIINSVSKFDYDRAIGCKLDDENFYVSPAVDLFPLTVHGRVNPNDYHKNNSNPCLFENGIWAEIIEQPKQEIDFSVPGQLFKAISDGCILLYNGKSGPTYVGGTIVQSTTTSFPVGMHHQFWQKSDFILFKGSIGLKN